MDSIYFLFVAVMGGELFSVLDREGPLAAPAVECDQSGERAHPLGARCWAIVRAVDVHINCDAAAKGELAPIQRPHAHGNLHVVATAAGRACAARLCLQGLHLLPYICVEPNATRFCTQIQW